MLVKFSFNVNFIGNLSLTRNENCGYASTKPYCTLQKEERPDDIDHARMLTEAFVDVPVQAPAVLG